MQVVRRREMRRMVVVVVVVEGGGEEAELVLKERRAAVGFGESSSWSGIGICLVVSISLPPKIAGGEGERLDLLLD